MVLVILAAMAWFGRSAYRHYKEKHDLAQAQAFLATGDYRNALLSARQTLLLNPTNVPACRIMSELADISHSPAVLDWLRRIVENEPTVENKLAWATAGLRYQNPPFPLTAQILDELAPEATNLAAYQMVAASLALGTHQLGMAETHMAMAAKLDPTNQLYELNLAVMQLGSTNEAKTTSSREVLEKMSVGGKYELPALRSLIVDRQAHHDWTAAENYSTRLLASPRANLDDQLQHLGILKQLQSTNFALQLQSVQQQSATNGLAVALVSKWMQGNGMAVENIAWLTGLPPQLQVQQPVRLALSDAYVQNGDWRTLRDFTSRGNWDDMEFLRLALVAQAWSQLGIPQVADSNWGAAINACDGRFGALTALLGLAEQWKLPDRQEKILQQIVQRFPRERWAVRALEQSYLTAGNTAALQQLYARILPVFPADTGLKNNLAATCLLLNTNVPQACQWAAEAYAQTTNDVVVTSTYAYALHLEGRTAEGLAIFQKMDAAHLEQPAAALYYGVLLAAAGETNQAAPFLQIARNYSHWLPEEQRLLATSLGEH